MATTEVNLENHGEITSGDGASVLYFWADWCSPCKLFGPVYGEVSDSYENVSFGKVNVDEQRELSSAYRVRSIPSLVFYKDGEPVLARTGAMAEEEFRSTIDELLEESS